MAQDHQNFSKTSLLREMRESIDWEVEESRRVFFRDFYPLIENWNDGLPNLRDIFQQGEIELLLVDSVKYCGKGPHTYDGVYRFINVVVSTGYKDVPKVDKEGNPVLHRTTPVHLAAWSQLVHFVPELLKIYDRFDVNYSDEYGYTHFHAACMSGCDDAVEKFLEFGQDPNVPVPSSNCSPLYLAVFCRKESRKKRIELLLRRGADPTVANKEGVTPLHLIGSNVDCARMIFEIKSDVRKTARLVGARDYWGRTPLHEAVRGKHVDLIELLLRKGADPNAVDRSGKTPLQLVPESNVELLELFRKIREEREEVMVIDVED